MYGIYGDVIGAAKQALAEYQETEELLEYPEIQADKAYYLSVLSKYNNLKLIQDKLSALISALDGERAASALLAEARDDAERTAIYEEISALQRSAFSICVSLSDALGCKHLNERAYCRLKCKASKFAVSLFALIKTDLLSHGAKLTDEKTVAAKGGSVEEISFTAEGEDVLTRLMPLTGAHKIYLSQSKSEELCFAVTPAASVEKILEEDLKIDVFRSNGAGGQNINKVETAVRVTHLPTGLVVVCQDERSQLQNKKRALETIEKRLKERGEQAEKQRMEADIRAQFSHKNTPISFDFINQTMTDTRLKAFTKIPFPLTDGQFTSYLNGLIAL